MTRVLAVLNSLTTAESVLDVAFDLADQIDGSAWALHPRPLQDPSFMPTEEVMTTERRDKFESAAGHIAEGIRELYSEKRRGRLSSENRDLAEVVGDPARTVAVEARRASLVVLGHPLENDTSEVRAAFHAALYDASASVVSTPLKPPATIGREPVIAWEASAALDKAIRGAWPILLKAKHVTILHARERRAAEEDSAARLIKTLSDAGVTSSADDFSPGELPVGDALLNEAKERNSDLLIMGAYTHNPMFEWLRSGSTLGMLQHARIPLLMHH